MTEQGPAGPAGSQAIYVSLVALHDAVGDGQAQAGAPAHVLGGEEGVEDARQSTSGGMPGPVSSTSSTT